MTWMSDDDAIGPVGKDFRVRGMDNLFVCDGSGWREAIPLISLFTDTCGCTERESSVQPKARRPLRKRRG
jgi:hypothetical protein